MENTSGKQGGHLNSEHTHVRQHTHMLVLQLILALHTSVAASNED